MSNPTETSAQGWPLSIIDGPTATFTLVREALQRAQFNEAAICERVGIRQIVDFTSRREGRPEGSRVGDALEVLIDLFLDIADVPSTHVVQQLGEDVFNAMREIGLLEVKEAAATVHATVLLYPAAGVLLTSDRTFGREGEKRELPADVVYPSITRNSATFVKMLPPSPCEAFLEMCAGNGIAAIAMASRATRSWSLDITERATRVAHFNARLNGFDNVSALQGDLYAPVAGLTFDRIVAHPPYVASAEQRLIYRDGGPDGELITRKIVAELPTYLRPGGRFYCTCVATDRANATFEHRLREWLGEAHHEFDIVVAVTTMEHPSEFYFKRAMRGGMTFAEAEQRHVAFKEMQVEQLVYCSFYIERCRDPERVGREPATVRVRRTPDNTGRELERLCDWLSRRESPDLHQQMLAAYPLVHRQARLKHTDVLFNEKWQEAHIEFETTWPFVVTLQCPADVAHLLARCDGTRTVKQIITWLRQKGILKASSPDAAVLATLASCVAAGAVFLEDAERSVRSSS